MFLSTCQVYCDFWQKHPALLIGISLLMGGVCRLGFQIYYLVVLAALFLPLLKKRQLCLFATVAYLIGFLSTSLRCPEITLAKNISGIGTFKPQSIKMVSSPFCRSLLYQGTLMDFATKEQTYHKLPCSIYLPIYGKRPSCDAIYQIEGILQQKSPCLFILKPNKKKPWRNVSYLRNAIEWRFSTKQSISTFIRKQVRNRTTAVFLSALATGQIDERLLTMQFGKLGLQHLLVISGFHFALLAYLLRSVFNWVLPYKITALATLFCLSLYYIFLGNAPSIQRAYISIAALLIGELLDYPSSGLNTIVLALLVELLVFPLSITELGFQLTFLCTFAILLLYQPTEHLFMLSFAQSHKKRTYQHAFYRQIRLQSFTSLAQLSCSKHRGSYRNSSSIALRISPIPLTQVHL